MGRAQIISEAGGGLYTIEVKHDAMAADSQLSKLNAILSQVEARIAEEQARDDPNQSVIAALTIRKTALEKRIDALTEARDADYRTEAWCADLTEGLSGEVGTIEPGTEYKNGINIHPGYDGRAAWSASRDGQAVPFLTMDVADAMRNFAAMPAVQKWRPTYRYGTITGIDYDANTASVNLDATTGFLQDIDINQTTALSNVQVDYMSCDAAAFKLYDQVIVEFDANNWSWPKIIGFKNNPKECAIYLKIESINGVTFPDAYSNYELCLMQPITSQVTHYKKGDYTEDYTVIGYGTVDNSGVVKIEREIGIEINMDSPLYVGIKNQWKWMYWTTDWKGNMPYKGIKFSDSYRVQWTNYPTGDLSQYDYVVDSVEWTQTDIDIRLEIKTDFETASGDEVIGYSLDITGIKLIRLDHHEYYLTDLDCNDGNTVWPDNNYNAHNYRIINYIPYDLNYSLWNSHYFVLSQPIHCYQTKGTFVCNGGESGQAYRIYWPYDMYAENGTKDVSCGTPLILTNRFGQNPSFTQTTVELTCEGSYFCQYIWMETIGGYVCIHINPDETVWDDDCCEEDFGVISPGNPCESRPNVSCGDTIAEVGECMIYTMIDLDENYI